MIQALGHRSGRTTCARPKFAKFCAEAWRPIGALVIFLPVQLALFLSVKFGELVDSHDNLSTHADYPKVTLERQEVREKPDGSEPILKSGRIFRSVLAVSSPPLWPQDKSKFPFTVPDAAQSAINAFCAARRHYGHVERTSLEGQIGLAPRAMCVKFHLAELPQQMDSEDRSHCYTSEKSHSGPLALYDRLCNQFTQEELTKYVNFDLLSPQAESHLSRSVDVAFPIDGPPEKKQKQTRASSVRARAPLAPLSSSRSWHSSGWQESSSSGWRDRSSSLRSRTPGETHSDSSAWHSGGWQETSSSSWQTRTWNWQERQR